MSYDISHYQGLSKWNYMVVLGIAISGIAAWQATYNVSSGIGSEIIKCEQSDDLKNKLQAKFIATMILSSLAVVVGILLSWFVRKYATTFGIGLATAGIFGIVYGLSEKFSDTSNTIKLVSSWSSLFIFVLIGILIDWSSSKSTGELGDVELQDIAPAAEASE